MFITFMYSATRSDQSRLTMNISSTDLLLNSSFPVPPASAKFCCPDTVSSACFSLHIKVADH